MNDKFQVRLRTNLRLRFRLRLRKNLTPALTFFPKLGRGYAKSRREEFALMSHIAQLEGILLDPVYTGKAMYGLADQIKKGRFRKGQKILFIHTGGIFGLFPFREWFKTS